MFFFYHDFVICFLAIPGLRTQCSQGRLLQVAAIKTQESQPYEAASPDEQPSNQILHRKLLQTNCERADLQRNENAKHGLHCLRRAVTFDLHWPKKIEANFKRVEA